MIVQTEWSQDTKWHKINRIQIHPAYLEWRILLCYPLYTFIMIHRRNRRDQILHHTAFSTHSPRSFFSMSSNFFSFGVRLARMNAEWLSQNTERDNWIQLLFNCKGEERGVGGKEPRTNCNRFDGEIADLLNYFRSWRPLGARHEVLVHGEILEERCVVRGIFPNVGPNLPCPRMTCWVGARLRSFIFP